MAFFKAEKQPENHHFACHHTGLPNWPLQTYAKSNRAEILPQLSVNFHRYHRLNDSMFIHLSLFLNIIILYCLVI